MVAQTLKKVASSGNTDAPYLSAHSFVGYLFGMTCEITQIWA